MNKYIWEIKQDKNGMPIKNKYTIIYENKTYVYCKRNSSDELVRFEQNIIDSGRDSRCFLTKNGESVNGDFLKSVRKKEQIKELQDRINTYYNYVRVAERDINYYNIRIEDLNKELNKIEGNSNG